MLKKILILTMLCSGILSLSGCGIKGPLYMPEENDSEICGQYPDDECPTDESGDGRFFTAPDDPNGGAYFNPFSL